jgi:hypothetical protein
MVKPATQSGETVGAKRLSWVWDYDIDEDRFRQMLAGNLCIGRLGRDWAAVRLLEHAPYAEIIRLLGFRDLVIGWSEWREHVRSPSRRRGIDFLVEWLPAHRPELLEAK